MLCALCRQNKPDVSLRPDVCPGYLCNLCYEIEKTDHALRMSQNIGEMNRLSERLEQLKKQRGRPED